MYCFVCEVQQSEVVKGGQWCCYACGFPERAGINDAAAYKEKLEKRKKALEKSKRAGHTIAAGA